MNEIRRPEMGGFTDQRLDWRRGVRHAEMVPPRCSRHRIVAKVDELMALLDRLEERLVSMTVAPHSESARE